MAKGHSVQFSAAVCGRTFFTPYIICLHFLYVTAFFGEGILFCFPLPFICLSCVASHPSHFSLILIVVSSHGIVHDFVQNSFFEKATFPVSPPVSFISGRSAAAVAARRRQRRQHSGSGGSLGTAWRQLGGSLAAAAAAVRRQRQLGGGGVSLAAAWQAD